MRAEIHLLAVVPVFDGHGIEGVTLIAGGIVHQHGHRTEVATGGFDRRLQGDEADQQVDRAAGDEADPCRDLE